MPLSAPLNLTSWYFAALKLESSKFDPLNLVLIEICPLKFGFSKLGYLKFAPLKFGSSKLSTSNFCFSIFSSLEIGFFKCTFQICSQKNPKANFLEWKPAKNDKTKNIVIIYKLFTTELDSYFFIFENQTKNKKVAKKQNQKVERRN